MQRVLKIRSTVIGLVVLLLFGAVGAVAAGSELAGSFTVNNELPDGWALSAALLRDGETGVIDTREVVSDGSTVGFAFADLEPGSYRVRLLASEEGTVLALGETEAVELGPGAEPPATDSWKAVGSGGTVAGEISLSGEAPEGRMILVRVRRVDIDLEGKFPDQLNAFTVEVQPEEIEAGQVTYEMSGLSYGLYAVELIAYHYETHTTQPIDEYGETLAVDLDHGEYRDVDFEVEF